MPTICQPTPLTSRRTDTNDVTLVVRTMGVGHHGTIPNRKVLAQVPSSHNRLLHYMGRSRTSSHYNREEHPKFRMEDSDMQIWNTTSTCVRQRKTVRQPKIQRVLPRVRHPQPLFISWLSISQRTS